VFLLNLYKRGKMSLDTVFSKSFKDYKKNFKITALATLLFRLLPILVIAPLIFILVTVPYINLTADFAQRIIDMSSDVNYTDAGMNLASLTGNAVSEEVVISEMVEFFRQLFLIGLRAIPFSLLLWILGLIFSIVLFYSAFNNKEGKLRFGDALGKSMHYFWKFLGFTLLIYLIMILLSLGLAALTFLFVVTFVGIFLLPFLFLGFFILVVYLIVIWGLAVYFIFDEDCGVFESLRKSKELVKGRFWKVLGYILLMGLILIAVSLVFWMIAYLFTLPFGAGAINQAAMMEDFNKVQYAEVVVQQALAKTASNYIIEILAALTTTPFMIFYFKNLYQELKEEKKKKSGKQEKGKKKKPKTQRA
jgi:hypothetical protein